jgi:chromate transporter
VISLAWVFISLLLLVKLRLNVVYLIGLSVLLGLVRYLAGI